MQLVQGSLVSYQGHTFLKACGGESLLVLVVTLKRPGVQMASSPRWQLRAGGLCCPSENWCEIGCRQGLWLHTPPPRNGCCLCLCSPALPGMVSRSPQHGGWGCLWWRLSYLGALGLFPSHCRYMHVEKTTVVLGHTWGSMYISRASEIYISIKTVSMIFFFP